LNTPVLSQEEANEKIIVNNPGNEDIHAKMNACKNCNDYHYLFFNHETYCDQPSNQFGCDGKDADYWKDENTKNHFITGSFINKVDERELPNFKLKGKPVISQD